MGSWPYNIVRSLCSLVHIVETPKNSDSRVVQSFPACLVRKAPPCCEYLVLPSLFIRRDVFVIINLYVFYTQVKYVASRFIKSWRVLCWDTWIKSRWIARGEHWKKSLSHEGEWAEKFDYLGRTEMGKTVSSSFLVLLSTIKSKAYFVLYRSIKSEVDLTLFCMMWPCKHLYAVWG